MTAFLLGFAVGLLFWLGFYDRLSQKQRTPLQRSADDMARRNLTIIKPYRGVHHGDSTAGHDGL